MQNKNLIITGLMGSGKTTLGRLVAKALQRPFIDTDEYLVEHYGPAADILSQPNGDELFRLTEEKVARELSQQTGLVISTGGRFMLNQTNIDLMQRSGKVFCLHAELGEIVNRLNAADSDTYRPRFVKAKDKLALMQQLLAQSLPYFEQFTTVQTTKRTMPEIVAEIIEQFAAECAE